MVAIPKKAGTVEAIWAWREKSDGDSRRPHLGASIIGKSCRRALWYEFRGVVKKTWPGRMLRLFERGQREEEVVVRELRGVGCKVSDVDPQTNEQWRFTDEGGHVGGSMDAAVQGLEEAPKTWHVVEIKTANEKATKELQKSGVEKAKPLHYAQMQLYMHWSKMRRAAYFSVCKNDDTIYYERVKYDKKKAEELLDRATAVVTSPVPLERISEKPDWYECKYCDHYEVCHHDELPEVWCRTCAHATPVIRSEGGRWACEYHGTELSWSDQKAGCKQHRYIPDLLPWRQVDADGGENWVEYDRNGVRFRNGPPGKSSYSSLDLRNLARTPALLGDTGMDMIREKFDAEVIECKNQAEPFNDPIPF